MRVSEAVDRRLSLPVYRQVYGILGRELAESVYEGFDTLPSEKELCGRFGIERNTLRKSLQLLVDDGLVEKAPGYGTRIVHQSPEEEKQPAGMRSNILMLTCETDPLGSQVEYFHLKLMKLLESRISEMGYNLVFKTLNQNNRLAEVVVYTCPSAILFDSYIRSQYYHEALSLSIPCISINHYTPFFTSVVSNNFDGAYKVAKLMTAAGHQKIALITGKNGYQTTTERLSGFQSLYLQKQLVQDGKYIFTGNWLFDSGFDIGEKILTMPRDERPTAVFAFNDDLAYGCLNCFEKHGVSVPDEISLVGFDRSDRYEGVFRPITTVDVSIEDIVQYACWCLEDRLKGKSPKALAKIQVETTIIEKGTVQKISP